MEKYGALTVIDTFKASDRSWDVRCRCICDCGKEVTVLRGNLRSGRTKSCGCMSSTLRSEKNKKVNEYFERDGYIVGLATNSGAEFYIDRDDFELIKPFGWYEMSHGYMGHKSGNRIQTMHRLIMGEPSGKVIDHINHNKKDNRKENLRICTQKDNMANLKTKPKGITIAHRGNRTYYIVYLHGYRGCFKDINEAKALRDSILANEYL